MTDSKDTDIRRAIENLASAQKKAMNRQLASEALLYSLLEIVPVEMLQKLEDEYDAALLRLAEQVPPSLQIPELWEDFSKAIAGQKKYRGSV
ncbi:hypothetical protein [Sphaerotilus sp.]|jgi:hypothetical protein|uniref:hypothetical protein n=1 Tax=Sphaerotilus sp. TaxID=2093942 RepID=UPI0025FBB656|nr:hypothetical protein [Sphaerotilus sp.]